MNAISKCYMLSWDNSLEGDEIFQHSRGSDEGDDWQFYQQELRANIV